MDIVFPQLFFFLCADAAHLSLCKLCAAYALKVEQIDKMLTKKYANKGKEEQFDDSELQLFKERMKKKLGKKS